MFGLFKKKTYEKTINHEDWLLIDGEPAVFIPKKEHKCGKKPTVIIDGARTVFALITDKGVLIKRGLPIYQGTFFVTKIRIV